MRIRAIQEPVFSVANTDFEGGGDDHGYGDCMFLVIYAQPSHSQKNARGRISIAHTGRFRTAMIPLIDFSKDSGYKVGAFKATSVTTAETKWWAGACAWANPARILNVGSCAIKKNLWPSPCDPFQRLQLERRRGTGVGISPCCPCCCVRNTRMYGTDSARE